MCQTRANLDSIYSLYEDQSGAAGEVISRTLATPPASEAHDCNGELHRLWIIDDSAAIRKLQDALADRQIAIADGHHRYETALAYRDEIRRQHPNAENPPSEYVLMTLVDADSRDLTIFPTYRVVGNVDAGRIASLPSELPKRFRLQPSSPESLLDDMAAAGHDALGAYLGNGGGAYVLRAHQDRLPVSVEGEPEPIRRLPVTALHRLILDECLGIGAESLLNEANVTYTRDEKQAFAMVDKEGRQAAFFLNETPVRDVIEVAKSGGKMPQKATYFYPKLLSGLVLRLMNDPASEEVVTL
jgi:uncharacterized protein (DUF1015 family)